MVGCWLARLNKAHTGRGAQFVSSDSDFGVGVGRAAEGPEYDDAEKCHRKHLHYGAKLANMVQLDEFGPKQVKDHQNADFRAGEAHPAQPW